MSLRFIAASAAHRRLAAALLCVLLGTPCSVTYAQPSNSEVNWIDRWALQFQITDDVLLDDLQGAALSAKKQVSATEAIRFGTDVSIGFEERTRDAGLGDPRTQDRNTQLIRATVQYLRYPASEGNLKMYWGLGPALGLSRIQQEGTNQPEQTQRGFSIGVEGALGAEWFVHAQISLTAEYGIGAEYGREVQTVDMGRRTEEEVTTDRFDLGARPVRLGLSVYF